MNAGKKRKLIQPGTLSALYLLRDLGVPLQRAMLDTGIAEADISRPAVAKLVKLYHGMTCEQFGSDTELVMRKSLFPEWLTAAKSIVQEQPDDWKYVGYFPLGEWQKADVE